MNDLHASRLTEWVIHRLGMALLWSLIAGTVCGVLAGVQHEAAWLYVGGFAAPLAGAFTLVASRAPYPETEDSEVDS